MLSESSVYLYINLFIMIKGKKILKYAAKGLKNTIMSNKSDRSKHAYSVIKNHVLMAMGVSFIPIPIVFDVFAVGALQLDMIRQLCKVYNIDFAENQGKAIVSSLTSSTLARAGARSLIKLVPGIGSVVGGVAASAMNGASTYALGEVFKKHFETGGTILDFDTESFKKMYKEKFEKGKKVAEQWKKEEEAKKKEEEAAKADQEATTTETPANTATASSSNNIIEKLKELGQLKEAGIISEEEFAEMKKKLIEDF